MMRDVAVRDQHLGQRLKVAHLQFHVSSFIFKGLKRGLGVC